LLQNAFFQSPHLLNELITCLLTYYNAAIDAELKFVWDYDRIGAFNITENNWKIANIVKLFP